MDTAELTKKRGVKYGHPLDHFSLSEKLYSPWRTEFHKRQGFHGILAEDMMAVSHCAKFIIDKLVRAIVSPYEEDHWDDIAGYAKCAKDAIEEQVRRTGSNYQGSCEE